MNGSWNVRCEKSCQAEKKEIERKYNIRIGQTEIHCADCGRSCWPGRHSCQNIRLRELNEGKKLSEGEVETVSLKKNSELYFKLKTLGAKKVATMLYDEEDGVVLRDVTENTVRAWIKRRSIPIRYQELLSTL